MLLLIGAILTVIGACVIVVVVLRAVPQIARLTSAPRALAASREFALKERLFLERLTRRVLGFGTAIGRRVSTRFRGWESQLQRTYRRLRLLAQEHATSNGAPRAVSCAAHLTAADAAVEREELEEAEEHLLACLKLDPKHRDAYLGLASLYRKRKEDALAEETLRFLRKLSPEDHEVAALFAEVLRDRAKGSAALKEIAAAIALVPRNPKYLDFAIELAIVEQSQPLAQRYLDQLREANPENQKLAEFGERIAGIET